MESKRIRPWMMWPAAALAAALVAGCGRDEEPAEPPAPAEPAVSAPVVEEAAPAAPEPVAEEPVAAEEVAEEPAPRPPVEPGAVIDHSRDLLEFHARRTVDGLGSLLEELQSRAQEASGEAAEAIEAEIEAVRSRMTEAQVELDKLVGG